MAAAYAAFGVFWIIVSDLVASSIASDSNALELAQRCKGIAFIAITSAGLFLLVRHGYRGRQVALEAARAGELQVRDLFLRHPRPMWLYDISTLRFLSVNDAAISKYGYTRKEFLAMTLHDIRPADEVERMLGAARRNPTEPQRAGVFQHITKEGGRLFADITSHVVPFRGRSARLVMAQDVTQATKTTIALRELTQQLERRVADRTEELQFVNQELDAFSRTAAHDLKTPLNGILGFIELLRIQYGPALGPDGERMAAQIQTSAERMSILIDDLLAMSRVTTVDVQPSQVDLAEIATGVIDDLRASDPARVVTVLIRTPMHLRGDAGLLCSLMANLIGNAWKFSARKAGAVIEVGWKKTADGTVHFVRDNGAGFDMRAAATKLFQPFCRFHSVRDFGGTGVGLATCQRIVRRHGGSIWIESTLGAGTTVYFSLTRSSADSIKPSPGLHPMAIAGDRVQDTAMSDPSSRPTPPLQEAVLAWAAAVELVEQEALQIIRGGPVDRTRIAALLTAVETERIRCEQRAATLFPNTEESSVKV